jgi:NAD(P)-dependent dehydrogenase (short-subunit alcohol dehydrogenase family)
MTAEGTPVSGSSSVSGSRPDVPDRLAVVTGGNKGIGRACAERLLRDGHRLVVTGRDEAALKQTAEDLGHLGDVTPLAFDIADEGAVRDHLESLAVDVLVASAGIAHSAPLHRTTLEEWNRVLSVNATGVFLAARAVLPRMRERDWGRVVTVASVAGHQGVRYGSAYAASKHAAVGLTRSIATEVAGTGVTANSVCPAFVDTAMTDQSVERIVGATGRGEAEARAALEQMSPLGRLVRPDEVAAAVAYLASDAAAAVNGQSIILDGGGIQQ